jgi:cellulose synthase/poly-beta-1,6-N-acetylglucosamine synthase-like glycosyltransferase
MEQLKPATRATAIIVFLLVLNILNMVDRNLITSFGSVIIADLELSDSQFGLLTGFIFVFFLFRYGSIYGCPGR